MSACLIMLTNTYPFNGGEYFIENEIDIISCSFDKIMIFALDADKNAPLTRSIPENVSAEITGKYSRKRERAGDLADALIHMLFSEKKKKSNGETDIKRKLFREYFCARSERQIKQVLEKLSVEELKKYDEVIIYSYWLFVSASVAVKLKEHLIKMGVKVKKAVSRAHGYDLYEERNSLKYLPERDYLLKNLNAVFTCSRDGEKYLKEKYPAFAEKVEYSPLGTKDHGSVSLNKTDKFTIVTCSSLNPVKRVWRVADALSLYRGEKEIKWIHIGGSGKKLQKLKTYTESKLSGKNAAFEFKGQMTNDKVNDFYLSNPPDLFLNVSESEGVPVSIMEAASFGIPVLAADCGGTGEVVENSVTGKLIHKDFSDSELMSEIQNFMFLKEHEIKKMSEAGRSMWAEKYNGEKNYSDFASKLLSDI